jgi:hypothetical protein
MEKETEFKSSNLSEIVMMLTITKLTAKIQRGYLALKEKLEFIFVNGETVNSSKDILSVTPKPYPGNKSIMNECIFLPFIQKDGNIKFDSDNTEAEIREDYLRNAFKDGIKMIISKNGNSYNFTNKNFDEEMLKIFESIPDEKRQELLKISKFDTKKNIEIQKKYNIYFYPKVLEKLKKDNLYMSFYKNETYVTSEEKKYLFFTSQVNKTKVTFDTGGVYKRYGYNPYDILTRDNYEFEAKVDINQQNILKGTISVVDREVLIKNTNNKNKINSLDVEKVNEDYSTYIFKSKDYQKQEANDKYVDGLGELKVEDEIIGKNIKEFKLVKNEDGKMVESEEWYKMTKC